MKIGFIFSGQGAQYVGMGKELYENFQSFRSICERANQALDFDITNLMFDGEKEQLHITEMGLIVSGNYWWDDIYVYKYDK